MASFMRCSSELLLSDVVNECHGTAHPPMHLPLMVPSISENQTLAQNEVLIPNPYELNGYAQWQAYQARDVSSLPFAKRSDTVFYRGDRKAMCAGHSRDARFVAHRIAQASPHILNFSSEHQPKAAFAQHKFLLDIGGTDGTTWDALRWKMATGSLVFRVASGRHTHFSRQLRPWVHYVPVAGDLNDLTALHTWALRNQYEANKIARTGQNFALETSGMAHICLSLVYVMQQTKVCSAPRTIPCVGIHSPFDWQKRL